MVSGYRAPLDPGAQDSGTTYLETVLHVSSRTGAGTDSNLFVLLRFWFQSVLT